MRTQWRRFARQASRHRWLEKVIASNEKEQPSLSADAQPERMYWRRGYQPGRRRASLALPRGNDSRTRLRCGAAFDANEPPTALQTGLAYGQGRARALEVGRLGRIRRCERQLAFESRACSWFQRQGNARRSGAPLMHLIAGSLDADAHVQQAPRDRTGQPWPSASRRRAARLGVSRAPGSMAR